MTSIPPPKSLTAAATDSTRDEPSITEVNGTIARFEMAFSPKEDDRFVFGPPRAQLIPALCYLGFACVVMLLVVFAYTSSGQGRLYTWLIEGDRDRPVPSWLLASIIFVSGIAVALRSRMRGVVVTADGIEARYLLALGVPRIAKWTWAQLDRFVIDSDRIMLELWNSTHEVLPPVADTEALGDLIEKIAAAKKKEVSRLRPQL
jgi:hypothetical protein